MSRLATALRLYPAGTLMSPAMMKDHKAMQRMIDNDPDYFKFNYGGTVPNTERPAGGGRTLYWK